MFHVCSNPFGTHSGPGQPQILTPHLPPQCPGGRNLSSPRPSPGAYRWRDQRCHHTPPGGAVLHLQLRLQNDTEVRLLLLNWTHTHTCCVLIWAFVGYRLKWRKIQTDDLHFCLQFVS